MWPTTSCWILLVVYAHTYFHFYGCTPSGGSGVPIMWRPFGRKRYLDWFNYFRYDISSVFLGYLKYTSSFARLWLWRLIEELPWIFKLSDSVVKGSSPKVYRLLGVYLNFFFFGLDKFYSRLISTLCLKIIFS